MKSPELIALNQEDLSKIKKELVCIAAIFALFTLIFRIALYKEDMAVLIRAVMSIFWLFVLPGYFLMLYWAENLDFIERLVIGAALAAGVIGTSSYYLGLIGVNVKHHAIIMPSILMFLGIGISLKR